MNVRVSYADLPVAQWYKPEPYIGCPSCEAREFGAIDPFTKPLVYSCEECGTKFRLPPEMGGAQVPPAGSRDHSTILPALENYYTGGGAT